ncbi:hypothetical protein I79_002884 [Cricetulus griseus]|uniref:Uncharacterized protein n=1 Tax=Cricetulus griseus TaxID=10029 RepID=G3GYK4_CRIGR|nr:hypothetical protein I79_002884 [Cricetulus griseus]
MAGALSGWRCQGITYIKVGDREPCRDARREMESSSFDNSNAGHPPRVPQGPEPEGKC